MIYYTRTSRSSWPFSPIQIQNTESKDKPKPSPYDDLMLEMNAFTAHIAGVLASRLAKIQSQIEEMKSSVVANAGWDNADWLNVLSKISQIEGFVEEHLLQFPGYFHKTQEEKTQ